MSEFKGLLSALALLSISFIGFAEPVELNLVSCHVSKDAYIADLVNAYREKTGIRINIHAGNSTSAIRDVQIGVADIGGTSRYLIPNEKRETGVKLVPVARDALAIIVHRDNPVESISQDQFKAIYTGRIRYWSELGGNDQKIEVFAHKNKISGNGRILRELLFSNTNKQFHTRRVFDSLEELEEALIHNPNAIAITGVSSAQMQDVKIVALDGVIPSIQNIKTGDYSLYRPLFLTYAPHSPNIEPVKDFIRFVLGKTGQEVMRSNGVVPYRETMSLVRKNARENNTAYPHIVGEI